MENSRTFQEYPTISQFSRTFKAHANHGEEKSPVILFTKTGYPEHLLQSILYKKSCHNTHCCRKRSSTDSFPFKCSLINIWSYNKRRGTLEKEWRKNVNTQYWNKIFIFLVKRFYHEMPKSKFTECFSFFSLQTSNCLSLVPGVWVGYGGVKTLENRSCKFNFFYLLPLASIRLYGWHFK